MSTQTVTTITVIDEDGLTVHVDEAAPITVLVEEAPVIDVHVGESSDPTVISVFDEDALLTVHVEEEVPIDVHIEEPEVISVFLAEFGPQGIPGPNPFWIGPTPPSDPVAKPLWVDTSGA